MKYEIRKVNANWEHPKDAEGNYIPQREDAKQKGCNLTVLGFGFSMDKRVSRHSNPTHFQLYEVESKGTPITPVFQTQEELKKYLMSYGDFIMQTEDNSKWNESDAQKLIDKDTFSSNLGCDIIL